MYIRLRMREQNKKILIAVSLGAACLLLIILLIILLSGPTLGRAARPTCLLAETDNLIILQA